MDIYVCKMSGKIQNRSTTTTITFTFEIQIFFSQLPNLIFLSTYKPTYVTCADVAKYGADHLLLLLGNALYNSYFPSLDHTPSSWLSGWSCQLCHVVNSSPLWWLSLTVHPYTNTLPNRLEKRFRIMLCIAIFETKIFTFYFHNSIQNSIQINNESRWSGLIVTYTKKENWM